MFVMFTIICTTNACMRSVFYLLTIIMQISRFAGYDNIIVFVFTEIFTIVIVAFFSQLFISHVIPPGKLSCFVRLSCTTYHVI